MRKLKNRFAMVTGASSGLGVDFANILAAKRCNLILVARRQERLNALSLKLKKKYGVRVEIIPQDLSLPGAPTIVFKKIKQLRIGVDILINNAGMGHYGKFMEIPWEDERDMLRLDLLNLVHLSKLFIGEMLKRKFGYVLNVASIAAFQPVPYYSSYAGAKSFVLSHSEALNYELRNTGVRISALCPGVTATEFFDAAGQHSLTFFQKLTMMKSHTVARIGIRAMFAGKPFIIAGFLNTLSMFCLRFIPRRIMVFLASQLMEGGNDFR
ncbi:SDR family NAD(P)-dependent oxidoreductase [Candidatus Riflebacteria bacterium]